MNTQPVTKKLQVTLSPEELELKTKELARTIEQLPVVRIEAKEASKKWADKVKEMEARALDLAGCVTTGKETREIPVNERVDARRFVVETIRHDTMQVISERALTQDEMEELRQGDLFTKHAESTADSSDRAPANDDAAPAAPAPDPTVLEAMAEKGAIDDPAAVLANDAGLDAEAPKGRRGRKVADAHPEPTE